MKKIIILAILTLLALSIWAEKANWLVNYDQALKLSAQKKLPILVNFTGSDWCIWCKRLDSEVFSQKEFVDYATKNLILLKIDFPKDNKQNDVERKTNKDLANKYKIEGFPTILIVNAKGDELQRTGYQEGGAVKYVKHLKDLLKK